MPTCASRNAAEPSASSTTGAGPCSRRASASWTGRSCSWARRVAAPGNDLARAVTEATGETVDKPASLRELLKRPGVDARSLAGALASGRIAIDGPVLEQLEIDAKYEGYMRRQDDEIERVKANEEYTLPQDFDYLSISGLSNELKDKLCERRPETIAQAARVPGVTPAALSLLLVHAKRDTELGLA